MGYQPIPDSLDRIARQIVDAAFTVHTQLGPRLLEKVYEKCMKYELKKCILYVESQVPVPIIYDGIDIDEELRIDLLVEREVIVELKAVEVMHPVYDAQLLSYLKLTNKRLGLLINFNVELIKNGIKRKVL